jgi:F-type H+-transporting ATPase subunit a
MRLTGRRGGALLALALPSAALAAPSAALGAEEEERRFNPIDEFLLEDWVSLPLGLGINKAVVYLWIAAVISVVVTLWIVRGGLRVQPGRTQAVVEILYGFLETNVGRATLPQKAYARWFPYIAALFVFIWVLNIISFLPLPVDTRNKWFGIPGLSIYAATSSISVTLALALLTVFITHVEGIRANGVGPYFKSWVPPSPGWLKPVLVVLETLSHFVRIVSLSVRLFANMLAGHLLILLCVGFAILLANYFVALIAIPVAVVFYVLEFVLIASLQAYIFALLSGIYIGGAIEPAHH